MGCYIPQTIFASFGESCNTFVPFGKSMRIQQKQRIRPLYLGILKKQQTYQLINFENFLLNINEFFCRILVSIVLFNGVYPPINVVLNALHVRTGLEYNAVKTIRLRKHSNHKC